MSYQHVAAWRKAHPEKHREYSRAYRIRHGISEPFLPVAPVLELIEQRHREASYNAIAERLAINLGGSEASWISWLYVARHRQRFIRQRQADRVCSALGVPLLNLYPELTAVSA